MNKTLLDKCKNFEEADKVKSLGLYPYFRPIATGQHTWVKLANGKKVLMMGSNSYMGLTDDPRVIEAAIDAWSSLSVIIYSPLPTSVEITP